MIVLAVVAVLLIAGQLCRYKLATPHQFNLKSRLYSLSDAYFGLLRPFLPAFCRHPIGKNYLRYARLCHLDVDCCDALALICSRSLVYLNLGLALFATFIWREMAAILQMMALIGTFLLASLPFVKLRRRYKEMRDDILRTLPTFVYQLAMLIRAGATVESAISLIFERLDSEKPWARLLSRVQLAMARGEHFSDAFAVLPDMVQSKEVHHLVLLMSQVSRTGVYRFSEQLIELGDMVLRDRQAVIKTISEQLSTKLLLPMLLSMMMIMALLVYPILTQL